MWKYVSTTKYNKVHLFGLDVCAKKIVVGVLKTTLFPTNSIISNTNNTKYTFF